MYWESFRNVIGKDRGDAIHQSLQVLHENKGKWDEDDTLGHRKAVGEAYGVDWEEDELVSNAKIY